VVGANAGIFQHTFTDGNNTITLDWTISDDPIYQPSPAPGTKGRIGNGALFDGQSYIEITDATVPAELTNEFTIMGWIRPQTVGSGIERLFGAGNEASVNGYNIALDNGQLLFQTNGVEQYLSNVTIEPDLWQHIAVVFDSNNDAHFYLDGAFQETVTGTSPANANNDDPLFIGARIDVNGNIVQAFTGLIDELGVYGRSLTTAELYGIYLRELRWYRDKATSYLTIDTDKPTIELLSDADYWQNGYIQLAVATTDATSAVRLLDFGLKAPGESVFSWQGAVRCVESINSSGAWCPYFDSTLLGGEGVYELQFRVVDGVGNETFSSIYTLYVDGTAPTATSNYSGEWMLPSSQDDVALQWTVTLSGTLNDPDLATIPPVAGSGVATDTVLVDLVDGTGGRFSDEPQAATVNGTTWTIDYQMRGVRPQGTYSITLSLADWVGNEAAVTVGTVRLDERPATVDFNGWDLSTTISQTMVLSGTSSDLPDWGGDVVSHHFEEAVGATTFYNTASSQFYTITHSSCISCPNAGISTLFGNGVQFNGTDERIDTPFVLNPATETFAVSVWINVASLGSQRVILQQLDGTGTGRTWLYVLGGNGKIQSNLGGVLATTTAVTVGEWHHVALTYDGKILYLYLDGNLEASGVRSPEWTDGTLQLGLSKGNGSPFAGILDEFTLYDRTLDAQEIYALAQKDVAGVATIELALKAADFMTETTTVITGWVPVTTNFNTETVLDWQYPLPPDLEDFYTIYLRGNDAFGNQGRTNAVWRGLIDMVSPVITATAQQTWDGNAPVTDYSFVFQDFILDDGSFVQPCAAGELVSLTYNDSNLPHDGLAYELSGSCRVAGHETSRDLTVCDVAGHCTTETVVARVAHLLIISKENATDARLQWTQPTGYCGYAVHRSPTPYFVPNAGTEIDTVSGGTNTYLLSGGLLTTPRFYTIVATDCISGVAIANEVGVMQMPIVAGD
jgi:hypothetical protein